MAVWLPENDDAGLEGYWLPSDATTLTMNGGTVEAIADKSGNGLDLSQVVAAAQPTVDQSIGGIDVLAFDGADDGLERLSTPIPTEVMFGIVYRVDSISSIYEPIMSVSGSSDWQIQAGNASNFLAAISARQCMSNFTPSGGPYNGPHILTFTFDRINNLVSMHIDGVQVGSTTYLIDLSTPVPLRMFENRNDNRSLDGACGTMWMTTSIDTASRQNYEGYFAHLFGLEGNLPVDHPYKDAPPTTGGGDDELTGADLSSVTAVDSPTIGQEHALTGTDLASATSFGAPALNEDFPTGWLHKVAITIDHTDIDADLTDWTLVFDEGFDAVLTQVNGPLDADGTRASIDGGGDIRFSSDSDGSNQLPVDIRSWSTDNTPGNAACEVAVKVPLVSSSASTTIYMWWGKAGKSQPLANSTYGQYNAYDSDHVIVYPGTDGAAGYNRCSASYSQPSENQGTEVDAQVGKGQSFAGSTSQTYDTPSDVTEIVPQIDFTVEALVKLNDLENDNDIALKGAEHYWGAPILFWHDNLVGDGPQSGNENVLSFMVQHQGSIAGENLISTPTDSMNNTNWRHCVARWDHNVRRSIYLDGSESVFSTSFVDQSQVPEDTADTLKWGNAGVGERDLDGTIDEMRFSTVARSSAWIKANYHNQLNTSGFLTWGSITDIGGGTDELTATDLASVTSIDSPTIGQEHALTGEDVSAESALDAPAIGQEHALTGTEIACATIFDSPTVEDVAGVDPLTGVDLVALTAIDAPTIEQEHQLTGADLASLTAVDLPVLLAVADVDPLTGQDLASASTVDDPTIGQVHVIDGADLIGEVVIDLPTFGQTHLLTVSGIAALSDISAPSLIIGAVYEVVNLSASFTQTVELEAQFAGVNT